MTDDSKDDGPSNSRKRPWWEIALIYPTLLVTLITALPTWADKVMSLANNVQGRDYREAKAQQELFAKNLDCTTAPFDWYINPSNVNLDATICQSGDVYVRASSPTGQASYYFVPVDRVLGKAAGNPVFSTANAAEHLAGPATPAIAEGPQRPEDLLQRVQIQQQQQRMLRMQSVVQTSVVCTKFLDGRRVLRHLKTPQACFDEIVDSLNGRTVSRAQVACRSTC